MRLQQHTHALITFTGIVALCAGPALLAGCGGGSSTLKSNTQQSTQQARPSQAQSSPDIGSAQAQVGHVQPGSSASRRDRAQISHPTRAHTVQRAHLTPESSKDDSHSVVAVQVNPCTLVSVSEAEAITGGPITGRVEAPLGPTCIYRRGSPKAAITLAVESTSFASVTREMTKPARILVKGRRAYCGKLGTQMLFVPLPDGTVLTVAAPCAVARRFAATALSRLTA
jgi:hypothetical protein